MTMPSSVSKYSKENSSDNGTTPRSKRQGWNNPFRKQKVDKSSSPAAANPNPNPQDSNNAPSEQTMSNLRNSTAKLSFSKKAFKKVGVVSIEQYGYEETDYGYGPAEPDSATIEKYGYEETQQSYDEPPRPRRVQRRSSMPCSHLGEGGPQVTPRRSSIKPAGAPRRESITNRGEIEIVLPPSKKGEGRQVIKRRTSLTFNDETTVTPIEPAKNLARSPEDLWFQDEEMQQIRKKVSALIHKTEDGYTPHNGKRYCMRGLERMMEPEVVAVKRSQAWDTVFKEQYLQKCEGVYEEDHLANLYTFSTLRSKKDAEARASEDAKEVENYLRDARRTYRRMSM